MVSLKKLAASLAVATFGLAGACSYAADFPSKPVNVIVPQSPGGTNDIVARIISEKLAQTLEQPFVVQNKPGAGGNIGTAYVAREPADGYTVLFTISSAQAINPAIYKDPGFDPVKDFAPVAAVGSVPNVLCINPSFPAHTLADFIKLVKGNPDKYQYASAGNGSLNHLLGAMLDEKGDLKLQHIPYRGVAPGIADVLGGQVPIIFASLPSSIANIKSGKLVALGVSTPKRNPALPDVPAIGEQIPGYSGELWIAMYVPRGTPDAVIETLHKATAEAVASDDVKAKFAQLGVESLNDGPEQLARRLDEDMKLWATIVKSSGAQIN